jgi:hypothetical protein
MKRTTAKGKSEKVRARTERSARRPSRVQRSRKRTVQPTVTVANNFARWATSYPWDGQRLGTALVDTSQLACECGECAGCQGRVG